MLKAILFDLDGTLLPMDLDEFTKVYFKGLVKKMAPHGYSPEELTAGIWKAIRDMLQNNGDCFNEEVFWQRATEFFGERIISDKSLFDDYYKTDFQKVSSVCGFNPEAKNTIKKLKADGYLLVLATNPIFPIIATESRMRWAGLEPSDFALITTYENSHFCKSNTEYYKEIANKIGLDPEDCLMVGNDAEEDLAAEKIGMKVFLHTDCLINKNNINVSVYRKGGFAELCEYISELSK